MGNLPCSCVVIAGNATEESVQKGRAAAKIYAGPLDGAKGNLVGPCIDVANMKKFWFDRRCCAPEQIDWKVFQNAGTKTRKADVMSAIRNAMYSKGTPFAKIYFSGHGGSHTGDWCFEDASGKITEHITCEDLLDMWQEACREFPKKTLEIVADCCHSGVWVEKARHRQSERLMVSASCNSIQLSWDTPEGGAFTRAYLDCGNSQTSAAGKGNSVIGGEIFNGNSVPLAKAKQTPCQYVAADWFEQRDMSDVGRST